MALDRAQRKEEKLRREIAYTEEQECRAMQAAIKARHQLTHGPLTPKSALTLTLTLTLTFTHSP